MEKIKLGDKVKCKITGYIGIAVSKTEYLNGCIQYSVAGRVGKTNKLPLEGDPSIDEQCLEVVKPKEAKPKKKVEESNGGATRFGQKMRGY